ncbi:MAG: GNAT family N-acetyltransferase [Myxococcales bacterium]|nr:GNAT family N-acetyltransferase [Myxococcales bacterium]
MEWIYQPWSSLSVETLYAIMALRQRVFTVEQRCPYLDADGADPKAVHLWCLGPSGALSAYARLFGPGVKYPECSIGRVVTAPEVRGTGLGRALVAESLARLDAAYGPRAAVRISAQAHLEAFYGAFGFVGEGETYLEDDILHREMVRR